MYGQTQDIWKIELSHTPKYGQTLEVTRQKDSNVSQQHSNRTLCKSRRVRNSELEFLYRTQIEIFVEVVILGQRNFHLFSIAQNSYEK